METIKTVLFLLVAGLLAGAGILVVVGGGDGEFRREGIVRISHPYNSTFEVFTKPKNRLLWVPGITTCVASAGQLDVGSRLREVVTIDGVKTERIYEVKAYTPGKKFSVAASDELCDYDVTYTFGAHQTGRKTRLDYAIHAQYREWSDKLLEPIRGADLESRVRAELEALKAILETSNEFR